MTRGFELHAAFVIGINSRRLCDQNRHMDVEIRDNLIGEFRSALDTLLERVHGSVLLNVESLLDSLVESIEFDQRDAESLAVRFCRMTDRLILESERACRSLYEIGTEMGEILLHNDLIERQEFEENAQSISHLADQLQNEGVHENVVVRLKSLQDDFDFSFHLGSPLSEAMQAAVNLTELAVVNLLLDADMSPTIVFEVDRVDGKIRVYDQEIDIDATGLGVELRSHDESLELFEDLEAMVASGEEESIYFDEHYIHAFARGMLWIYEKRNVCEWPQPVYFPSQHDVATGVRSGIRQLMQITDAAQQILFDKNEEMILKYGVTAEQFMAMSDAVQAELERNDLEEPDEEGEEWKRGLSDEDE